MKFEPVITGFEEFDKLLKQLPQTVENKILQQATDLAATIPLAAIKAAAPRHKGKRSPASQQYGTLYANVRKARLKSAKKGTKGTRISTSRAFWGYIIEKGSRYHPANPWFDPAFWSVEQQMRKVLGSEIGKGIEREAKKAYRGGRR